MMDSSNLQRFLQSDPTYSCLTDKSLTSAAALQSDPLPEYNLIRNSKCLRSHEQQQKKLQLSSERFSSQQRICGRRASR